MSNFPNALDDKKFYVYCFINNKNGKMYIGKTKDIQKRCNEHKIADGKCPAFHNAINKYGMDSFEFIVLNKYNTEKESLDAETYYISKYNSNTREFGYNLTDGGDGISGFKHSEESKTRMSISKTGDKNHMYGKKHSYLSKEKISTNHIGNTNAKGTVRTIESKIKQSVAMTGKYIGENHPLWDTVRPENVRKKISNSLIGKVSGENNPNSKLTIEIINEIISLYNTKKYSYLKLAKMFDVGKSTIARIIIQPDYFGRGAINE